ncbi:hypothetical protein MUK42_03042 [Musa troglodytarum]|uniref:Uncharacterized protein n=1 Tax=Musa troglodytarum TaxID=320322 RepID=A0A9E7FWT6_9LILI|nr:hypothetical protein MUK42_03042 [Musa troglodytarum]
MASNPPSFHHHCRSLLPSTSSPPSPHCSFPSPAAGVSKALPPSRSIPILLPIVFLFFLLLFFLSIFLFRDILHFTYAFFYGGGRRDGRRNRHRRGPRTRRMQERGGRMPTRVQHDEAEQNLSYKNIVLCLPHASFLGMSAEADREDPLSLTLRWLWPTSSE